MVHIGNSWDDILADEFKKEYYLKLREFLKYEYSHFTVYPDMHDIFNSLKYTPYEKKSRLLSLDRILTMVGTGSWSLFFR